MLKIKEFIKAEAEKLGFCLCGFTGPEPVSDYERYLLWLSQDSVGTMNYLKRPDTLAKRADLRLLLSDVQSICVLGVPMELMPPADGPEVASYAHYADYHETIKPMAETLVGIIQEQAQTPLAYRICIDSSPVLERSLAVRAGLGWIGKSSMFISPLCGPALLLSEIMLDLFIEPDEPYTRDGCGSCCRCVEACPNRCIDPETRTIRADRCAAYLTIEHKGDFSQEQVRLVGNHLFGCDACLRACPWNSRGSGSSPLPRTDALPDMNDYELSDADFKLKFQNSPVLRTKAKGLRRNIEAVRQNQMTID